MKFTITLKDSEGFADSVCEAVTNATSDLAAEMTPREYGDLCERRAGELFDLLKRWFGDDDSVRLEVDTIAKTIRVLELEAPRA